MIHSIKIRGYRAFADFSLNGLGRINLFVGKNNTGKTSLLEALSLLWAGNDLSTMWGTLARRGEQAVPEPQPGRGIIQEVDVSHFFTGHKINVGSEFVITTTNQRPGKEIKYRIDESLPEDNQVLFAQLASLEPGGAVLPLRITGTGTPIPAIPLTGRGTLRTDIFNQAANMVRAAAKSESKRPQYITTASLSVGELLQLWNDVALLPEEALVMRALQFIDAHFERIAPMTSQYFLSNRGGFWLKRKDEDRVPIGSFGEGIWRILSLAVALSKAKDSILLVDEIDTGLHHTVMTDLWRFIDEISKEFKIQVFATTHSYDCIQSLAKVCRDVPTDQNEISIQRIESGKDSAIAFTERQIRIAAEREIEIR